MIKTTYQQISNFQFQSAMHKLSSAPTDGHTAYFIKQMNAALKPLRERIVKEYESDVMEKFAQRDEHGKFDKQTFQPIADKEEEFKKAQDEFEARTVEIDRPQLPARILKDVRLSALELEALDPILDASSFEQDADVGKTGGPNVMKLR